MIFLSVGTYVLGFDELVGAMDEICGRAGLPAFAQIGNSSILPVNMQYQHFLSAEEMRQRLQQASLVVCHGGFGIIGDAMRAKKPIIAFPRQNTANSNKAPANNQLQVSMKLKEMFNIDVCENRADLEKLVMAVSSADKCFQDYDIRCNVPSIIDRFLLDCVMSES